MKQFLLIPILSLFFSFDCSSQTKSNDFNDELINLVVKYSDGNICQIFITDDEKKEFYEAEIKNTQPILVEKLLQIGFKISESKFEGFGKECASIKFILQKDDCYCTVFRVYEYTKLEGRYKIRENIDCKRKPAHSDIHNR